MAHIHEIELPAPLNFSPDLCKGSVFFVGTATVIIRYAGFTILTDPNFLHAGDHAHLGYGLTSKRLTNPAIEFDDLPPVDFCLLSHLHGDHFDRIAEQRLDRDLPIITTPHAAAALKNKGFRRTVALCTWDAARIVKGTSRLLLYAAPGRHATGRLSSLLLPVMGSLLDFGSTVGKNIYRIYISGDTVLIPELRDIPRRFPNVDLALLHLGGARLLNLFTVSMDAAQGVEALRIIRPDAAIPIHYNDYTVFRSPLNDFRRAVANAELATGIIYLTHGETYEFDATACPREEAA